MVEASFSTRPLVPGDADALLADVQAGFDSYVSFSGPDWRPPSMAAERERIVEIVSADATWGLLAHVEGRPIGHVAFFPGRERSTGEGGASRSKRPVVPGLAHLWQLFVMPDWWGQGVAPTLHDGAIDEMRAQGYERARLFTPSLHARARRFYERRGWTADHEEWNERLAMTMVEYHRALA